MDADVDAKDPNSKFWKGPNSSRSEITVVELFEH